MRLLGSTLARVRSARSGWLARRGAPFGKGAIRVHDQRAAINPNIRWTVDGVAAKYRRHGGGVGVNKGEVQLVVLEKIKYSSFERVAVLCAVDEPTLFRE